MNERSAVFLGVVVGAALGGFAGFLLLTERGRRLRDELEPTVDGMYRSALAVRDTVERARAAAAEGWRGGEAGAEPAGAHGEQHVPF